MRWKVTPAPRPAEARGRDQHLLDASRPTLTQRQLLPLFKRSRSAMSADVLPVCRGVPAGRWRAGAERHARWPRGKWSGLLGAEQGAPAGRRAGGPVELHPHAEADRGGLAGGVRRGDGDRRHAPSRPRPLGYGGGDDVDSVAAANGQNLGSVRACRLALHGSEPLGQEDIKSATKTIKCAKM